MPKLLFFLGLLVMLTACRRDRTPPERQLAVGATGTTLYAAPGKDAAVVAQLPPGAVLADLGAVSSFVTPLLLADSLFQAPWLQVEQPAGPRGWVFAAAVAPVGGDYKAWLLQKRLDCFVGPALREKITAWRQGLEAASDEAALADAYARADTLRSVTLRQLHRRAEPNEAGFEPDVFWLTDAFPGFVVQRVPAAARTAAGDSTGRVPWLFFDYRSWLARARQTAGPQDDRFFEVFCRAFPGDSIESFFPVWTIQTGERLGSSQLGSGAHLAMFAQIDEALPQTPLFAARFLALKDRLIDDVASGQVTYWQPQDKIIAELDEIIARRFACLTDRDRLALEERRKSFEDAAANGIRVNLRSGE
jgi:hypothetical protein